MDTAHFDQWTKRITAGTNSRRGLLRLGLGGGLAALIFGRVTEEVTACRRTGKPCAKDKLNGGCCSGTCRRGKCRPTAGAAGCRVNQDACGTGKLIPCPANANGFCVKLDNGKPFCAVVGVCQPCTSNASCTAGPNGKCLKHCLECTGTSNGQACFYAPA